MIDLLNLYAYLRLIDQTIQRMKLQLQFPSVQVNVHLMLFKSDIFRISDSWRHLVNMMREASVQQRAPR